MAKACQSQTEGEWTDNLVSSYAMIILNDHIFKEIKKDQKKKNR